MSKEKNLIKEGVLSRENRMTGQGDKLASLRQEWQERIEAGETVPEILRKIKGKVNKKLAAILLAEWLRKNRLFEGDEFFIDPEGKHLLMRLDGEKFSKEKKVELRKLGFELLEERTGEGRTKTEKGLEPAPTKFEEARKLRVIPIDRDLFELVPYVIPYRLTESRLVHKEITEDNSLHLKYKVQSKGKTIIFNFLVPAEVLGKIKEKDIPKVGLLMRKSLYASLTLAFVQDTPSPSFKRAELMKLMGEESEKKGKLYSELDKGFLTWAYGTYTIISGEKVLEVGHIANTVKLAQKRGDRTIIEFNRELIKPLLRSEMQMEKRPYIPYPLELLKVKRKDMDPYIRNFCESLLKKQGMGRNVYPKFVGNILREDFGLPSKKLRKLGKPELDRILHKGFDEAKVRGLLRAYQFTKQSQTQAPFNFLRWKAKLILPEPPQNRTKN